jgi:hypothetical protein
VFNKSEQRTAELLWPFQRGWTALWVWAIRIFLVLFAIAYLFRSKLAGDTKGFVLCLLAGCFFTSGAAPFFALIPGLGIVGLGGMASPMHAPFPNRYDDIYGVLIKSNRIRIALWIPLVVAYGAGIGWALQNDAKYGATFACRLAATYFVIQPALVAGWISSNCSFNRRRWILLLPPLIFGLIVMMVLVPFWEGSLAVTIKQLLITAAIAKSIQLICRRCYRGVDVDLMTRRKVR